MPASNNKSAASVSSLKPAARIAQQALRDAQRQAIRDDQRHGLKPVILPNPTRKP
jgi:hypothetical protein